MESSLWGEGYDRKTTALNQALKEIENKYNDWFKSKESTSDKLANHYLISHCQIPNNRYRTILSFRNDSDLPSYIREECCSAFNKFFSDSTQDSK